MLPSGAVRARAHHVEVFAVGRGDALRPGGRQRRGMNHRASAPAPGSSQAHTLLAQATTFTVDEKPVPSGSCSAMWR
jgi:hypothetical protein